MNNYLLKIEYDGSYFIGLVTYEMAGNFWILGDIFLKKYFVSWNIEDNKIGITKNHDATPYTSICKRI